MRERNGRADEAMDRTLLTADTAIDRQQMRHTPPSGQTEAAIAQLYAEVLKLDPQR